jgi:hypothetical protein
MGREATSDGTDRRRILGRRMTRGRQVRLWALLSGLLAVGLIVSCDLKDRCRERRFSGTQRCTAQPGTSDQSPVPQQRSADLEVLRVTAVVMTGLNIRFRITGAMMATRNLAMSQWCLDNAVWLHPEGEVDPNGRRASPFGNIDYGLVTYQYASTPGGTGNEDPDLWAGGGWYRDPADGSWYRMDSWLLPIPAPQEPAYGAMAGTTQNART